MWRDIFLNNKEAVLEVLGRFNEDLAALTRAVRNGDAEKFYNVFAERRAIRRGMIQFDLGSPAPDFGRAESSRSPIPCRGRMPRWTKT